MNAAEISKINVPICECGKKLRTQGEKERQICDDRMIDELNDTEAFDG